jgi:hypothetical protein
VIVVAVTALLCKICPPTVLNWPLKPTPVVRWMTIVTERAVIAPVLFSRTTSSLYQGVLELIADVAVTPPSPTGASFTVRPTVVVRVRVPPVPVTVIVAAPSVAVLDAARVRTLLPAVV